MGFCLTLALSGCGHHHASIVGKWIHPLGASGKAGMVYEFHPDATMTHYSQVDVSTQIPGTGIMLSPKFNGTYTFRDGLLVYHTTSITAEGKTDSVDGAKAVDQQYKADLTGDKLMLSRYDNHHEGPSEEYIRQ